MSDTPRTDEAVDYTAPEKLHSLCKDLERELAVEEVEKMKYRERAWRAELKLDERWGLRKEITAALGITDETGDDALRKGLETIKALKAERSWNRLSDGMPTKDEPVLILAKMYYNGEPIICAAIWDGSYWFPHGASGYDCEIEFDTKTITHWMQLPKQPQVMS